MSHNDIGPKLRQLRELGQEKRTAKKPAVTELREKVATVKPKAKKTGRKK